MHKFCITMKNSHGMPLHVHLFFVEDGDDIAETLMYNMRLVLNGVILDVGDTFEITEEA